MFFAECPKSIASKVLIELRSYPGLKLIRQGVFKISRSQAINCILHSINFQSFLAAIFFFAECPKSIASKVLIVLRSYPGLKLIRQNVFKISHSQAIVDGQTDGPTDGRTGP